MISQNDTRILPSAVAECKPMTSYDDKQRRCPRLGGQVSFGYCRMDGEHQSPCFKVLDCWWERFDVVSYFRQRLSKEAFEKLKRPSTPNKVASLVDLIQQAQKRVKSK